MIISTKKRHVEITSVELFQYRSLSLSLSLFPCSFSLFCLPVLNNYSAHQIDIVLYCAQAVIFTRKGKFNYFWRKSIIRNANKINNQRQLQNEYKQLSYDSLSYFLFKLLIFQKFEINFFDSNFLQF